ncbi:MAG TPA: hypothetical protein VML19_32960 [Verrucomicrobiae bacterium]|nr:hypothetical protein [Verrucomicrobiae bacterium]
MRNPLTVFILAGGLAGFGSLPLAAQYSPSPETYSVTQVNNLFGPGAIMRFFRDGTKARVDTNTAAAQPGGKAMHVRTIYDLSAHTNISWDPMAQPPACSTGTWGGDWGDPFKSSIEMNSDIQSKHYKPSATEMVNNVSTQVYDEDMGADGKAKVWIEPKFGLVMRAQMGAAPPLKTVLETQVFSLNKPPAATFDIPPACKAALAAPSPDDVKTADETGEPASNFVIATHVTEASPQSCTVLFRMVQYKTMNTITEPYQIGLDRDPDDKNSGDYAFGRDANGTMLVKGGHLAEVTSQMRNGVLRIENATPEFYIVIRVPNGGASSAIRRQCFGPVTTLLLVVDSLDRMGTRGDWLWVKSGKQAGH